jgi:putative endonuclease
MQRSPHSIQNRGTRQTRYIKPPLWSFITDKLQSLCHPERCLSRVAKTTSEGPMQDSRERSYFVYIMSNRSKTLYTGVTNNLPRRVLEHKAGAGSEFCSHYKLDRLVYFERFQYVGNAIAREKQIKGLLRIKKIALIVEQNPSWRDLSKGWYEPISFRKQG